MTYVDADYCDACVNWVEHCTCEPKPAPPEVPAPDEVWVTFRKGTLYNVWRTLEGARHYESAGDDVHVRYVRARKGGR